MSESALPPEDRARVTQFNPLDLDRTVIATLGSDGTRERTLPRTIWLGLRLR